MRWQSSCNCNVEPTRVENIIKTWKDGHGRERETKEIYFTCGKCETRGSFVCKIMANNETSNGLDKEE